MYKSTVLFALLLLPNSFMCMDKSSDRPQKTEERRTRLAQLRQHNQARKLQQEAFDLMLAQQKKESDEILAMVDAIDLNDIASAQSKLQELQERVDKKS